MAPKTRKRKPGNAKTHLEKEVNVAAKVDNLHAPPAKTMINRNQMTTRSATRKAIEKLDRELIPENCEMAPSKKQKIKKLESAKKHRENAAAQEKNLHAPHAKKKTNQEQIADRSATLTTIKKFDRELIPETCGMALSEKSRETKTHVEKEENAEPPRKKTRAELLSAPLETLTPSECFDRDLLILETCDYELIGEDGIILEGRRNRQQDGSDDDDRSGREDESDEDDHYSSWGIPCELISPHRCSELAPMLNVADIVGGLWIPGDGVGDPHLFGMSLMREAVEQDVGVMEDCTVTAILSSDDKVCGVETTRGAIECQYFVNCVGFWTRQVGQVARLQVKVPLLPCEHYYLHTKTIEGLDPLTPVANCAQRCVVEDWDHFHVLLQRMPILSQAVLHKLYSGLVAFSPDCKWIVGEASEMINDHVAAGMKTVGIPAAGGVAEATADAIIDCHFKYDMIELGLNPGRSRYAAKVLTKPSLQVSGQKEGRLPSYEEGIQNLEHPYLS